MATPLVIVALLLLWFWIHRGGPSKKLLDKITISGFDKISQKEVGSGGSRDMPPLANAYFVGPAGDFVVTAPGFTVAKVNPPYDQPGMKHTLLYRGDAPGDCTLDVSRLYPNAELKSWVHLSGQQKSAFERGSSQILEVWVMCGG